MGEEDDVVWELLTSLESTRNEPLGLPTLRCLQTLIDNQKHNSITTTTNSVLITSLTTTMESQNPILSLNASNAFLSLLLSPNSPTLSLFSPLPFLSLLASIRRALKKPPARSNASDDDCTDNADVGGVSRNAKQGKRGKRWRAELRGETGGGGSGFGFDLELFLCVLERLGLVLQLVHLSRFPDCLKYLVHTVVEVPVLGRKVCGDLGSCGFGRLKDLCLSILCGVLRPEHGGEGETAAEVLKCLAPLVLNGKSHARSFGLEFVRKVLRSGADRSNGVKKAVVNFPRFLALKAPEKAEPRALAVGSIMEVVRCMNLEDQIGFTDYVVKMTQGKASLRLLAVDLITSLLMGLRDPFSSRSESDDSSVKESWGFRCLEALIQRCSDSSGVIRARALSNLALLVGFLSSDGQNHAVVEEVMGFRKASKGSVDGGVCDFLQKRCTDEKANVRRAALVLVTKLTALYGSNLDGAVLRTMGMACSDPLVSIRKAAISALSEAFRTSSEEAVMIEWLHSVPRLITDNESSIQEECENLFLELVLDRIWRAASTSTNRKESTSTKSSMRRKNIEKEMELLFPVGVLALLKEICHAEVAPWVKKICMSLGKKEKLRPRIATALQDIIRTSESHWLSRSMPIEKWTAPMGAWFLLSEVSSYLSKALDWEFLHHHWKLLDKYGGRGELKTPLTKQSMHEEEVEDVESDSVAWAGDRVFLLQTISNVSVELPPEPAADLAHNLLGRIEGFNMHSTEVNAHVRALRTLCTRKALNPGEANTLVRKWVQQVLSKASRILERYVLGTADENKENFFSTPLTHGDGNRKIAGAAASGSLSEAVTAVYTIGSLVIVCPSADTSNIVPIIHTIITSGNTDAKLSKLPAPVVSVKQTAPSLYIQSWLTMGKICLADGKLAKRYIPLFVQELEKSECAALRNNLVVMMADFCVHYTALVDTYISKITKCLRDPCELVRRQTFILLSRLLQRDYVKWRGVLFLRFLLSLVDESEKIRQLADYLFGNILKVKAPLLAYNSFVEAIIVLNDCTACNGNGGSKTSRAENRLFSIRGTDENSRSKRMHIYVSLLKQMAPEHLLATFAKLAAEILAAATDGMLKIDDVTGQSVLQDAFQILACKEIRLQPSRGSQSDSGDMEEETGDGGASSSAMKGRVITQVVRKGLIQNTIPIFIELKRLLESKNSPITGSLMECLRVLLKDYKNEIDEILIADRQLQKELIYDMQKYENAKAKSTAATLQNLGTNAPANETTKLQSNSKVASAMADAAAEATARSVLREVNRGALASPLSAMNIPKLKTNQNVNDNSGQNDRHLDVLESLRKRQSFSSDDED